MNYFSDYRVKSGGFTLIELLVVVLIIGILSAVALPQYQVAVAKSRLATVMSMTRALKDAQELIYLANNAYEDKVDNMGNIFPADCTNNGGGNVVCAKTKYDVGHIDVLGDVAGFTDINGWLIHYDHPAVTPANAGKAECLALSGNKTAEKVCKSYGGAKKGSFNSWIGNFDRYDLP